MSTSVISFASLVVRDIEGFNTPKYGNWSWQTDVLSANRVEFDDLVFDARPAKGEASAAQEVVDSGSYLVGGSNHIQHREFFAVVAAQAVSAADFTAGGIADTAAGSLFKLSDSGYGSRLTTLAAEATAEDPLRITGHGRISNGQVGELTAGIGFDNAWGFGLDNGPESGNRWLNDGDSIDFALTSGKLTKLSFVANVRGGEGAVADILLDVDGDVIATGSYGAAQNAARLDAVMTLSGVAHGARVEIDTLALTLTVDGVAVEGAGALFAALFADGLDSLTIGGGPDGAAGGFSVQDLAIERSEVVDLDCAALAALAADAATWAAFQDALGGTPLHFGGAPVTILGFEEFALGVGQERPLPEPGAAGAYAGFVWEQAGVFEPGVPAAFGLAYEAIGRNLAFVADMDGGNRPEYDPPTFAEDLPPGSPFAFSRAEAFDLLGAFFSDATGDGNTIIARGFQGATEVATQVIELAPGQGLSFVAFCDAFQDVTRVEFDSSGFAGNRYFGVDDILIA